MSENPHDFPCYDDATHDLIQISLTDRCNLSCEYCPMKSFRNGGEDGSSGHDVDVFAIIDMLKRLTNPSDTWIELTGGEPTLHPDFETLCDFLETNGYFVIIKTNGLHKTKKRSNILRVASFHLLNRPPEYYDKYLVILDTSCGMDKNESKNVKFDTQADEKIQYCLSRNIPYMTSGTEQGVFQVGVRAYAVAFPHVSGDTRIAHCYADRRNEKSVININKIPYGYACPSCSNIVGFTYTYKELN